MMTGCVGGDDPPSYRHDGCPWRNLKSKYPVMSIALRLIFVKRAERNLFLELADTFIGIYTEDAI